MDKYHDLGHRPRIHDKRTRKAKDHAIVFKMPEPPDPFSLQFESAERAMIKQFGKEVSARRDEVIRATITKLIGDDWTTESILPRLQAVPDRDDYLIKLDGQPILSFRLESFFTSVGDFTPYWKCRIKYTDLSQGFVRP